MKTISLILSIIAFLAITSCSDKKPEVVKKEIIVVPATPATTPAKNTTVIFDKNGVRIGTKKVDVIVNPPKKKQ